ncbi:MAG: coenzyme F420-0:L-glutamate ligase, partial [Chloroflexota bacterium]|nr:coenzyme F420-0:L-glutamate ligase [Chloroflexota bacterium]
MISLLPVEGLPLIQPGDPLADLIVESVESTGGVQDGDLLVIAQKIVSKAEGRVVDLSTVEPSADALLLAEQAEKDPRLVELILRESRTVVRIRPGLIVVEDCRGFIC